MKKILFKIIFIDTKVNKILQYCGNDIEGVAMNNGLIFDGFNPPPDMNKFLILIGSGSYLFNYLYFLSPREYLGMSYIAYLTERIVNINDTHASKKLNNIIAQEIIKKLE
ncbi:hypothetical protein ER57_17795 [Smithella sp. SCADC]|jgi:hypothetical protein|nr:hypothetical protein ER57_17795 [Smithella sp. SCADC]